MDINNVAASTLSSGLLAVALSKKYFSCNANSECACDCTVLECVVCYAQAEHTLSENKRQIEHRYVRNAKLWRASVASPFIEIFIFSDQTIQLPFFQVDTVLKHHKITSVLCASAKCCGLWNRHFRKRSIPPHFRTFTRCKSQTFPDNH